MLEGDVPQCDRLIETIRTELVCVGETILIQLFLAQPRPRFQQIPAQEHAHSLQRCWHAR